MTEQVRILTENAYRDKQQNEENYEKVSVHPQNLNTPLCSALVILPISCTQINQQNKVNRELAQ